LGGCGNDWSDFVPALSARYQLIIPDLHGHGGSSNPSGKFTMRDSASDLMRQFHGFKDSYDDMTFTAPHLGPSARARWWCWATATGSYPCRPPPTCTPPPRARRCGSCPKATTSPCTARASRNSNASRWAGRAEARLMAAGRHQD